MATDELPETAENLTVENAPEAAAVAIAPSIQTQGSNQPQGSSQPPSDRHAPEGGGGDPDDEDGGGLRLHVTLEEKLGIAGEVATRLFALLGGKVPGIECRAEEEQVVVQLHELDQALCPPGDTRVLESVQFILNKAINRYALKRTRLSIDAEGFRRRRPEGLDKVAQALAHKVLALGKAIAIGPLGQGDLRFLTAQLSRQAGVLVQATGVGDKRRLVIQPAGMVVAPPEVSAEPVESEEGAQEGQSDRRARRRRRR
jgi:predicted RNA-binding protein Jag